MTESPLRRTASFTVVLIFLVVILSFGIGNELSEYAGLFPTNSDRKCRARLDDSSLIPVAVTYQVCCKIDRPDFAQYIHVRDVSAKDLSLGVHILLECYDSTSIDLHVAGQTGRRAIVIGDIHGMDQAFQ